jgi:hypothetical protein
MEVEVLHNVKLSKGDKLASKERNLQTTYEKQVKTII